MCSFRAYVDLEELAPPLTIGFEGVEKAAPIPLTSLDEYK
jgi:hypothetical protein